jgi:hypothetical protein
MILKFRNSIQNVLLAICAGIFLAGPQAFAAPTVEWMREVDSIDGLTMNADGVGNVITAGDTFSKYDSTGTLVWSHPNEFPGFYGPAFLYLDEAGNIYTSGYTDAPSGPGPPYVRKLNQQGESQWVRLFNGREGIPLVSADNLGNVFVGGIQDLRNYDPQGNLLWSREGGTNEFYHRVGNVAADGLGNVYMAGTTRGNFPDSHGGADGFVTKYDSVGTRQWTRHVGTTQDDYIWDTVRDPSGNVLVAGWTYGDLAMPNAGERDAFVTKLDHFGNQLWSRQFGTTAEDYIASIASDDFGNVYALGETKGALDGLEPNDNPDVYVTKLNSTGVLEWTYQFRSPDWDHADGISADGLGNIFVSGHYVSGQRKEWIALLRDTPRGDFNADGTADAADYVVWRNGLGTTYTAAHYNEWRQNFGVTTAGSSSSFAAIPEPASLLLGLFALAATGLLRGRLFVRTL